jgi:hypothetical protein
VGPSQLSQNIGIAPAALAEVKVLPCHNMGNTKPLHEVAQHKMIRFQRRKLRIKRNRIQEICAQVLGQPRLQGRRREAEHRLLRLEICARVRLKRQDAERCIPRLREITGNPEQLLVAPVHAIKIANGNHSPPKAGIKPILNSKKFHSRPIQIPTDAAELSVVPPQVKPRPHKACLLQQRPRHRTLAT